MAKSTPDRPGGRYRLLVLGGGPAGMAAAREAARRGVRPALVLPADGEQEPREPAALARQIRQRQARFGLAGPQQPPAGPGIDVYAGRAVFCGRRAVAVDDRRLRFRKALIATGASPAAPEIEGADQDGCLWPETLTGLAELPRRLAVIGTGPSGCQWAQAFCHFGSRVHLIGREGTILPDEEPDAAAAIRAQLEKDGIRLHLGCGELAIETTGNLRGVVIGSGGQKEKLLVDRILMCGPRRPNTAGLGLETAGVVHDDRGIVVNGHLQTTERHIFAAGEVCGAEFASPQAAEASARLAVHNALGWLRRRVTRLVIPRCICTDPAVARVGLTREQAAAAGLEIETYRAELSEAGEAIPPSRRRGFVAVHVGRRSGRIVGATVVAEAADELIAPLVLLMTHKWRLAALAKVIPCRPGRFEVLTRLAGRLHGRTIPIKKGCA